eukprot:COSAG02_NODE_1359_length_13055_cov_31.608397_2_plen_63_part_00
MKPRRQSRPPGSAIPHFRPFHSGTLDSCLFDDLAAWEGGLDLDVKPRVVGELIRHAAPTNGH